MDNLKELKIAFLVVIGAVIGIFIVSTATITSGYMRILTGMCVKTNSFLVPNIFGKCPKLSYTKVSDKMAYANSVDPDQTAPV